MKNYILSDGKPISVPLDKEEEFLKQLEEQNLTATLESDGLGKSQGASQPQTNGVNQPQSNQQNITESKSEDGSLESQIDDPLEYKINMGEHKLAQNINTPGSQYMGSSATAKSGGEVNIIGFDGEEVTINLQQPTFDSTDPQEYDKQQWQKLEDLKKKTKENKDNPFITSGAAGVFGTRAGYRNQQIWGPKQLKQINNFLTDSGYSLDKKALTYELIKDDEVVFSSKNPSEVQNWAYNNFNEEDYKSLIPKKNETLKNLIDQSNAVQSDINETWDNKSAVDIIDMLHDEGNVSNSFYT